MWPCDRESPSHKDVEIEPAHAQNLLGEKGIEAPIVTQEMEQTPPPQRVHGETVATISHPEFRAFTKIALNYLAAVVGHKIALCAEFNAAREYVRLGQERSRVNVHFFENRWFKDRIGHYISLTRSGEFVVVQLSILMRNQYVVVLTESGDDVPLSSTAHFFDLSTKKIEEIEPLPLTFGRRLKRIGV